MGRSELLRDQRAVTMAISQVLFCTLLAVTLSRAISFDEDESQGFLDPSFEDWLDGNSQIFLRKNLADPKYNFGKRNGYFHFLHNLGPNRKPRSGGKAKVPMP